MKPKPVLPFRFLREFMGSRHDPEIAHCHHEPIQVRNAGFIRQCSAGVSLLPDESGVPMRRFRERAHGKRDVVVCASSQGSATSEGLS